MHLVHTKLQSLQQYNSAAGGSTAGKNSAVHVLLGIQNPRSVFT